jgi:hypothetical protein
VSTSASVIGEERAERASPERQRILRRAWLQRNRVRYARSTHAGALCIRARLLCSAGRRTEHIGAAVDAVERLERARAADVKALQRKKRLGARCNWDRAKWERPKWERPKGERPKCERPKCERPKWERPKWERPKWEGVKVGQVREGLMRA